MTNIEKRLNKFKKFDKSKRSNFDYWFWHWLAYNVVAWNLGAWKIKYLFHDIEKPWLRLFLPYEKVQSFHRSHSKHHFEWLERKLRKNSEKYKKYRGTDKVPFKYFLNILKHIESFDYTSTVIDWECSRYSKKAKKLDACGEYEKHFDYQYFKEKYPNLSEYYNTISQKTMDVIKKLKLKK